MKTTILQFTPTDDYLFNLNKLVKYIENSNSKLILAPEVCVTGFDYKNWKKANLFAEIIKKKILSISENKIISFSVIENEKNYAYLFYDKKIIYKRDKIKLFGYEKKYFQKGSIEPEIFEIEGIKFGVLICFEIRFIEYWQKLKGVDIVLIPAMWGIERKQHLLTLSNALGLSLQSYVIVSDGLAFGSGVISPWGEEKRSNDEVLNIDIDLKYIKKIRKKFLLE